MINKDFYKISLIVILLGLIAYLPLINGYFIHDEWQTFLDYFLLNKMNYLDAIKFLGVPQSGQYNPISVILAYSLFRLVGINYYVFFGLGLLLHSIASFLVGYFVGKLTNSEKSAYLAMFVFLIAPHYFQITSWVMANLGYSLAVIFLILGLLSFRKWIESGEDKFVFFSACFFVSSILSKEIGLTIILSLPIFVFLASKKLYLAIKSGIVTLPAVFYVAWRYWFLKNNTFQDYSVGSGFNFLSLVTLPVRSVVQAILPQDILLLFSKILLFPLPPFTLSKLSTTQFNLEVESFGAALVVVIIFCLVVFFGYYFVKTVKYRNIFFGGILFSIFSSFIYLFVDSKSFSLLQPRYLYVSMIGICLMWASVFELKSKKNLLPLLIVVLVYFYSLTFTYSLSFAKENTERHDILRKIKLSVPPGLNKTIIYTQSDRSFYGMPDDVKILPFQASSAKVIAAYVQNDNYIPLEVRKYETLKDLTSQGYFEDSMGGFGYFREYNDLEKLIEAKKDLVDDIFAFKYDSNRKELVDITDEVRKKIKKN